MAGMEVAAQRVWQFGVYLNSEVWGDFHLRVRDQAGLQGCNKAGFTGLISPLQGSMDWLHGKADWLLDTSIARLHGVSDGLFSTAYSYVGMDYDNRDKLDVPDNKRPRQDRGDGKGTGFSTDGSPFRNPNPVNPKAISANGQTITQAMEGKTRGSAEADAVNWIVRNFSEHLVIEPLTGASIASRSTERPGPTSAAC